MTSAETIPGRTDSRLAIVAAATKLLREDGAAAVTTRAVAQAAGVQPPMIYRLFGDKEGLLDAVAEQVLADYVTSKTAVVEAAAGDAIDPLDDLYAGWRSQIEFGLTNSALFTLLSEPTRGIRSPAARSAAEVLQIRVHRVAETGRLRVSEDRAVALIRSAGAGAVTTLLSTPPDQRDPALPDILYRAVLREILTEEGAEAGASPVASVIAVRALAPSLDALSAGERQLLGEWLDRAIADLQR